MKAISLKENEIVKEDFSKLYLSTFPENERPPLFWILNCIYKYEENHVFCYYQESTFIGFAYISIYKDIIYLGYLAVSEFQRNKGYGTKILKDIKERYKDYTIILCFEEVDDKYPDNEMRMRRKDFYNRNGFIENGLKTQGPVVYQSAYIGKHKVDFAHYTKLFDLCYGEGASKTYLKLVKEY